jgi:biopolymer transport protein ExbD
MRIPSSHLHSDRERDYGVMTPMIDVVFQLLIFFVVAAALGQMPESLLRTELAAAGAVQDAAAPIEREPWAVEVWVKLSLDRPSGRTVADMNGTVYEDLSQLKAQLRALSELSPDSPVILDNGDEVPLGDVISVYDTCRAAGFESVNFAADAPSGS